MVNKVIFSFLIMALACTAADAAGEDKNIVIVNSRSLKPYEESIKVFKKVIAQAGLEADIKSFLLTESKDKNLLIQQVSQSNPDLILGVGSEAAEVLVSHIENIPIVTAMVYEPVISDPANPMMHSVYLKIPDDMKLRLLSSVLPVYKKYSILCVDAADAAEAITLSRRSGLEISCVYADTPREFMKGFKEAAHRVHGHLMTLNVEIYNKAIIQDMLLFSARQKFPLIAISANYVKAGALLSFDTTYASNGQAAAELSLKLLRQEQVIDKHLVTPDVYMSVNRNVMKKFGISFKPSEDLSKIDYV